MLEQRGRACWGRKDNRKSIVVFHCSACVLQDFLQTAGTPKIPPGNIASLHNWLYCYNIYLETAWQASQTRYARFCLPTVKLNFCTILFFFVWSTWRACGRLLQNGEKSRCRDWPWTEYANLVLFLWMCSSHEILNVAGDEGDFSWGVQVSSERLWALSLLCCIPLHPTHHTVETTTRDCLEVGALTL